MSSSHPQADEHVLFHSWAQGFVISQLCINTHLKVLNMYNVCDRHIFVPSMLFKCQKCVMFKNGISKMPTH